MNSDTIQSLVRNILQVIMGILVTKGWVDNDNTELIIGGGSSVAVATGALSTSGSIARL